MKSCSIKNTHIYLGYFYIGLIIVYSISGIIMNHRNHWKPEKFKILTEEIQIQQNKKRNLSFQEINTIMNRIQLFEKVNHYCIRNGNLKILCDHSDVIIDLKSGKGEIIFYTKTPVIYQSLFLHKNISSWWIYYSDIFGISIIILAFSGIFIANKNENNFTKRGWKFILLGIIIPLLVFLFQDN
ncbi:conserved membrane hypothetical protein [Flavobacterium sp. 9AF]|uniref:PepSY-associated TM helix domain-containing protein n=1 Tax=Flavobacterium sp. 9AF TaxID=2653142 RepID=UPI0012F1EAC8|nr:PepSY-associated TM helix domain-containing protein [Flavobacterium sp. 9AF]VXC16268.1 conserved membrane hypothetical protein [Flavobacterium sp. 9AF]